MKKIGKIIGIIILIILVILIICLIRNIVIIKNLGKAHSDFFSSTNYSYTLKTDSGNGIGVDEYYYKDGKSVGIIKIEDKIVQKIWYDENTKERISFNPNKLTASIETAQDSGMPQITENILKGSLSETIAKACASVITTQKVNNEDCYFLNQVFAPGRPSIPNRYYFRKKDGKIVQCFIGESKIEFNDWKLNEVTNEDVSRPDLTGYEITYNK